MDARIKRATKIAISKLQTISSTKSGGVMPKDTGAVARSLRVVKEGRAGIQLTFDNRFRNPKTHQRVGQYIGYIDPSSGSPHANARNQDWFPNVCYVFATEIARALGSDYYVQK